MTSIRLWLIGVAEVFKRHEYSWVDRLADPGSPCLFGCKINHNMTGTKRNILSFLLVWLPIFVIASYFAADHASFWIGFIAGLLIKTLDYIIVGFGRT